MHLLIVEDDSALRHFLRRGLTLDGHDVDVAEDGEAALGCVANLPPEMMILDLGLPRMDGLDVLREMQTHFRSTSVLVLTGRSQLEERVKCLELGADDVIMKPFSLIELRTRLQTLYRRRGHFEDTLLRFGELEMDRAERKVTRAGREIVLTATEFSLLESLMRRRGERVCSRAEMLREVWRMPSRDAMEAGTAHRVDTNLVEVYINYLRKKLDRSPGALRASCAGGRSIIRTVRGQGYLLDTPGVRDAGAGEGDSSARPGSLFESGGRAANTGKERRGRDEKEQSH